MALIKCSECGKEISDKSKKCIHCGCPLNEKKKKSKKNKNSKNIYKYIIISVCAVLVIGLCALISFLPKKESNKNSTEGIEGITVHVFYNDDCSHCTELLNYLGSLTTPFKLEKHNTALDEEKALFDKVSKYFDNDLNAIPLMVVNGSYVLGFTEDEVKQVIEKEYQAYSSNSLKEEEKANFNLVAKIKNGNTKAPEVDNRTPKEKLIDYLKEHYDATCTDKKCSYTFEVAGLNDTSYYELNFDSKKYTLQNYSSGDSYTEYNYGKDKGYAKDVTTLAWTVTTEVNVTFDDAKGEYNYTFKSSMDGLDDVAKIMAGQVDSLRKDFKNWCNDLEINPSDI